MVDQLYTQRINIYIPEIMNTDTLKPAQVSQDEIINRFTKNANRKELQRQLILLNKKLILLLLAIAFIYPI